MSDAQKIAGAVAQVSEYVIHARLKNNLLLSRLLPFGSVSEFCRQHDLDEGRVGQLVNLRVPAVDRKGNWTRAAAALADALGVLPEEIFSEEQRTARLDRNDAFIEVTRQQALSMIDPLALIEGQQVVDELLKTKVRGGVLTPDESNVLRLRMEDETLDEIGAMRGVTRERIRQIENKATRKLRTLVASRAAMDREASAQLAKESFYFAKSIEQLQREEAEADAARRERIDKRRAARLALVAAGRAEQRIAKAAAGPWPECFDAVAQMLRGLLARGTRLILSGAEVRGLFDVWIEPKMRAAGQVDRLRGFCRHYGFSIHAGDADHWYVDAQTLGALRGVR